MSKESKNQTDECMVFLLAKAYQRGKRLIKQHLSPFGLTNVQYLVLEMLWQEPGLRAVELGKRLTIDKATMSGILERMDEAGWLKRERDAEDKRKYRLFASGRADGLRRELTEQRRLANEELLAGYSLEEKVLLGRLLKDIA